MCYLRLRTAAPFEAPSPRGYNKPTSRCQTAPSIRTLERHQPVIPNVPLIRYAMAQLLRYHRITKIGPISFNHRTPARIVILAVERAYAFALYRSFTHHIVMRLPELSLLRLRYSLEGCRPSKTLMQQMSVNYI